MCGQCCIKDLRWNAGKLQMLLGSNWVDVPGTPATSLPPNVPPLTPDDLPTQTNACFKITGVWNLFERMVDGLFEAWESASPETPLTVYLRMGHLHPEIKLDNYRHMSFWVDWTGEDRSALLTEWNTSKAELKELVLCQFQDIFSKDGLLSDADLTAWKNHTFVIGSGDLGDFLTDAIDNPEDSHYKEQASYAVADATGVCNCVGNTPVDPDEIPEGFGRIEVVFGQAFNLNNFPDGANTPQAFLDKIEKVGELITPTEVGSTSSPSIANNQGFAAMFIAPEGVIFTRFKFSFGWAAGSNDPVDVGLVYAATINGGWTMVYETQVPSGALNPNPDVTPDFVLNAVPARYIWYNGAAYGTDQNDHNVIRVSDIRFNLQAADGSWSRADVALGELFQL